MREINEDHFEHTIPLTNTLERLTAAFLFGDNGYKRGADEALMKTFEAQVEFVSDDDDKMTVFCRAQDKEKISTIFQAFVHRLKTTGNLDAGAMNDICASFAQPAAPAAKAPKGRQP